MTAFDSYDESHFREDFYSQSRCLALKLPILPTEQVSALLLSILRARIQLETLYVARSRSVDMTELLTNSPESLAHLGASPKRP